MDIWPPLTISSEPAEVEPRRAAAPALPSAVAVEPPRARVGAIPRDLAASDRNIGFDLDQVVDWVLAGVKLQSSVFHMGRYCGAFRASSAGQARASYHLVLSGRCFVHMEGRERLELGARDGIFFLRDIPHHLTDDPAGHGELGAPMLPIAAAARKESTGVALACGFFDFQGEWTELIIDSFPDYVVVRSGAQGLGPTALLFDLILAESGRAPDQPSPLVARLVDALFFYVVRHVAQGNSAPIGLWPLVRQPELARLVTQILREPGRDWSVEAMARAVNMSRASFFERFSELSGTTPAKLLLLLRMRVAAQRLQAGDRTAAVAEHVGYQSMAAFSRAFKKVIGEQPSVHRRASDSASATPLPDALHPLHARGRRSSNSYRRE